MSAETVGGLCVFNPAACGTLLFMQAVTAICGFGASRAQPAVGERLMKGKLVKALVAGLLCWTLVAEGQECELEEAWPGPPAQATAPATDAEVPEADRGQLPVQSLAAQDRGSKHSLRRTGVMASQVLLVATCVAGVVAAIAAPNSGVDPRWICHLGLGLAAALEKRAGSPRPSTFTRREVAPAEEPRLTAPEDSDPTLKQCRLPLTPLGVGGVFRRCSYIYQAKDKQAEQPPSLNYHYHSSSLRGPLFR